MSFSTSKLALLTVFSLLLVMSHQVLLAEDATESSILENEQKKTAILDGFYTNIFNDRSYRIDAGANKSFFVNGLIRLNFAAAFNDLNYLFIRNRTAVNNLVGEQDFPAIRLLFTGVPSSAFQFKMFLDFRAPLNGVISDRDALDRQADNAVDILGIFSGNNLTGSMTINAGVLGTINIDIGGAFYINNSILSFGKTERLALVHERYPWSDLPNSKQYFRSYIINQPSAIGSSYAVEYALFGTRGVKGIYLQAPTLPYGISWKGFVGFPEDTFRKEDPFAIQNLASFQNLSFQLDEHSRIGVSYTFHLLNPNNDNIVDVDNHVFTFSLKGSLEGIGLIYNIEAGFSKYNEAGRTINGTNIPIDATGASININLEKRFGSILGFRDISLGLFSYIIDPFYNALESGVLNASTVYQGSLAQAFNAFNQKISTGGFLEENYFYNNQASASLKLRLSMDHGAFNISYGIGSNLSGNHVKPQVIIPHKINHYHWFTHFYEYRSTSWKLSDTYVNSGWNQSFATGVAEPGGDRVDFIGYDYQYQGGSTIITYDATGTSGQNTLYNYLKFEFFYDLSSLWGSTEQVFWISNFYLGGIGNSSILPYMSASPLVDGFSFDTTFAIPLSEALTLILYGAIESYTAPNLAIQFNSFEYNFGGGINLSLPGNMALFARLTRYSYSENTTGYVNHNFAGTTIWTELKAYF